MLPPSTLGAVTVALRRAQSLLASIELKRLSPEASANDERSGAKRRPGSWQRYACRWYRSSAPANAANRLYASSRALSEAFRVMANNPGVARVAYSQLMRRDHRGFASEFLWNPQAG